MMSTGRLNFEQKREKVRPHQECTENVSIITIFFQWVSGACYSLSIFTYESLCSPTGRNRGGVKIILLTILLSESKTCVPSPPIYGCLIITIDCNAKREGQFIPSYSNYYAANHPHQLDLYETWGPWQDPSNVDSPKWLCETQDLIHEELGIGFYVRPNNLNLGRKLVWYWPCPILFTDFCFSTTSFPSELTASSSKK